MRRRRRKARALRYTATLSAEAARQVVLVETHADHRCRHQISNAHLTLQEQPDLCARNVVLYELLYNPDIVSPLGQSRESIVDVSTCSLDNEYPVSTEDVVQIFLAPDAYRTSRQHRMMAT